MTNENYRNDNPSRILGNDHAAPLSSSFQYRHAIGRMDRR